MPDPADPDSSRDTQSTDPAPADTLDTEARFFDEQDNVRRRSVSWGSIARFQRAINREFNLRELVRAKLKGTNRLGLTLACGDMTGEYDFFAHTAEVTSIDAYDISPGQRKKFFNRLDIDPDIEVNYQIADVNQISLPASTYDVVYIQQAFHHLEAIEHVAKEIHNALKPHGIFVLIDYIGPNQLQRSEKQRRICGEIWSGLPERLRTTAQGLVYDQIHIPKIEALPPFEAVRAEEIMGVLTDTFDVDSLFTYAGILFPLLEGFAQNYTESEEDQQLLAHLWRLDQELIYAGLVEPNFMRTILTRKT